MGKDLPDDDDLEIRPSDPASSDTFLGSSDDEGDFGGPLLPLPEPRGPGPLLWGGVGVLLLAGVAATVFLLRPKAPPTTSAPPAVATSGAPAAPTATPINLPSLEGSDTLVRQLASALSPHALLTAWLAQNDLVRLMTAVVANVAEGESPRPHLAVLAPKGSFAVLERARGRFVVDPKSYARYDPVADAFASTDAPAAARVYRTLEPLFEAAYRELGHPEGGVSASLEKALQNLAAVPVPDGDLPVIRVAKATVVYEYVDERLEALSVPQKHLLRMGPRNVARVQAKVKELADALGMKAPAEKH
jgi:hypothetical protein